MKNIDKPSNLPAQTGVQDFFAPPAVTSAEVVTYAYKPSLIEAMRSSRAMKFLRLGVSALMVSGVLAACGPMEEDYTIECDPGQRYATREIERNGQKLTEEACVNQNVQDNDPNIIWYYHNGSTYVPSSRGNTYVTPNSPELRGSKPPVVKPSTGFGSGSEGGSGAS